MRLGLLADIHEEIGFLDRSISALRALGVSRFVVLGDIFETGERLEPTVATLSQLDCAGVWGNHDFGLCGDEVRDCFQREHPPVVLDYFRTLRPFHESNGCWFQHIEPFLDSERLEDLWCYDRSELLDASRSFAAIAHRRIFMGHLHRWRLATPEGPVAWDGRSPVQLRADTRYLIVINAVREGCCAYYDTDQDVVVPLEVV